jgi:Glycosyltransferase family 87
MTAAARRLTPYALVTAIAAWLSLRIGSTGDWEGDAWPALHRLVHGDIAGYLSAKAMMGPFATLVQAPFVAISGASGLEAYRWAAFPCLLVTGFVGIELSKAARRRGQGRLAQMALPALCLLNPLTFEALELGHPEELLTAALAVWAVLAAAEDQPRRTALLLGLAVASKQWAVIAILPALMALPGRRIKVGFGAAGVIALLFLPTVVAAPGSFFGVQGEAAHTDRAVSPWSVWYPIASERTETYSAGGERLTAHLHDAPPLVGSLSHPLIVLLALALPVGLALGRRRFRLGGSEAMALLALLALLRCALDPVDNLYYQAPILLAVVGWDALCSRGSPYRSLVAAGAALVLWRLTHQPVQPAQLNAVYLLVAAGGLVAIASSVLGRPAWTGVPRIKLFVGLTPNSGD